MHFVTELQTQLSAQAQECLAAVQQRLVAEARLKKVIQSRDNLAAELAELRSGAATRPEDPAATVAELEQRLAEAEALLAAERRAREEDRHRHETHGQETGQTQQQVENTLRFITELQTRLRAETQERLEAEDKRLIAEDKRGGAVVPSPWTGRPGTIPAHFKRRRKFQGGAYRSAQGTAVHVADTSTRRAAGYAASPGSRRERCL